MIPTGHHDSATVWQTVVLQPVSLLAQGLAMVVLGD